MNAHLAVVTSLLEHRHTQSMVLVEESQSARPLLPRGGSASHARTAARTRPGISARSSNHVELRSAPCLWTAWDRAYVAGAGVVWVFGELVHPWVFGPSTLPFLPLMGVSVFGAVGVLACWGLSAARAPAPGGACGRLAGAAGNIYQTTTR